MTSRVSAGRAGTVTAVTANAEQPVTTDAPTRRGAGRPRRLAADDEERQIFEAALAVLRRNDYQDVTVADILTEAGMSTRSFYRHFGSKDELICALYRRDAARAVERLEAKVATAADPREAFEVWVDEILSFGFEPARASRVSLLGSASVLRAEGVADEAARAGELLTRSLVDILQRGHAEQVFATPDPVTDAVMVQAIVWAAAGLARSSATHRSRADARRAVLSFCFRALGVGTTA